MIEKLIIKKDGTEELYDFEKIKKAISRSASRVAHKFNQNEIKSIQKFIEERLLVSTTDKIPINVMHNLVEAALEYVNSKVAKSYKDYRNYKQDFVHMLDSVYTSAQSIMYIGDKENSNTDSALVATKRSLTLNELSKELYKKFFLSTEELQACKDGYIYVHDMSARMYTYNCMLFDMETVLKGGFEMGNLWYNEPKTLTTAFGVMCDVILNAAAQQYGSRTAVVKLA